MCHRLISLWYVGERQAAAAAAAAAAAVTEAEDGVWDAGGDGTSPTSSPYPLPSVEDS